MRKFKLFFLQVKSAFGYYIKGLSLLAAFFVIVIAIIIGIYGISHKEDSVALIDVAVVRSPDEQIMDYLISMLRGVEGVNSLCNMVEMNPENAFEALNAGEVALVIQVPDDFYEQASTLQDTHISIYIANAPSQTQKKLLAMLGGAEDLMGTTEGAILAMYEGMYAMDIPVTKGQMETDLFSEAVFGFLNRGDIFAITTLSAYGSYSVVQYYIASGWVMIIMISGMFFMGMYRHGEKQLERLVYRGPLSTLWASICRILAMTVTSGGIVTALAAITGVILNLCGTDIMRFNGRGVICIWIIASSTSVWVHFFASLTEDSAHTRVLYVLSVVLLLAATGVIVPSVYTPAFFRLFNQYLPGGTYHGLLLDGIWGKRRLDGVNIILITDVLIFVASLPIYQRRLRRHD